MTKVFHEQSNISTNNVDQAMEPYFSLWFREYVSPNNKAFNNNYIKIYVCV